MEPVEVIARYDQKGFVMPIRFIWHEQEYAVDATGRRWRDEKGLHVLVMATGNDVYELVFTSAEGRWYIRKIHNSHTTV